MYEICVGNPHNREDGHQRIAKQSYKQLNKEKRENTRFNEVRQFAYVLGTKGESSYWINQLQIINIGDATPPYISKETKKKRKPKNT